MASTLELPQFKGRPGWEFTDLSGLDLERYELSAVQPALGTAAPAGASFDGQTLRITGTITEPIELATLVPEGALANQKLTVVVDDGARAEIWERWTGEGVLNVTTELRV